LIRTPTLIPKEVFFDGQTSSLRWRPRQEVSLPNLAPI
jgi:hypothetical protein